MNRHTLRPEAVLAWTTAACLGYGLLIAATRPWYLRWGATDDEIRQPLPGDSLMHRPGAHHAVTIAAPAEAVWPWLAQIGQDRGGFYSYTWLENLALAGIRNADRVHPEWQRLRPGDTVRLASERVYGDLPLLRVAAVEPGRHLVLEGWGAFVLLPAGENTTRLLVRSHARKTGPLGTAFDVLVFEPAHFVMERKMLLGIRRRAEDAWSGSGSAGRPSVRDVLDAPR